MAHLHHKLPACANCSYAFPEGQPDDFCPDCGQQNQEVSLSFGHVMEEFLEGIFHFDSKVFRTAKLLLFKPGELTKRFLQGHRMPYVPPIRLYIFISFVFFFLLSLSVKPSSERPSKELIQAANRLSITDSIRISTPQTGPIRIDPNDKIPMIMPSGLNFSQAELLTLSEDPSAERLDSAIRSKGQKPTFLGKLALRQTVRSLNASPDELMHKWLKNLPILMFVLMPIFALLLKLLYRRHHQYYLAHLIFSIHFHCFVFILFIFYLLLGRFGQNDSFELVLLVLPAVYFFMALRNNFNQSYLKTLAKVFIMMNAYGIIMALTTMLSVLTSLLML
jgi:hypothetical protein